MQEGFEWYEMQQSSLEYKFINEVEEGYKKICDHPFNNSAVNARFRRLKINRFPYLVIYELEGNTILLMR
jgi:toxin ParE1/3/4